MFRIVFTVDSRSRLSEKLNCVKFDSQFPLAFPKHYLLRDNTKAVSIAFTMFA